MELYIIKSTAILAVLFLFYKLVLENTSIHNFKRLYLLGSLLVSFLIPFITFTNYVEVSSTVTSYSADNFQNVFFEAEETINYWPIVLWTIYGVGVLFFSLSFLRNLFSITQQIRNNPKYRNGNFINVLLEENIIPHTFFSYIFLNKGQFETDDIPAEVMLHEEAHASQKHSLDIIIIELLKIIFWFNPLIYLMKRSIKLNHEFLADASVLKKGVETSAYQKLLLAFATSNSYCNNLTPELAHAINYSSMKKRFSIMKTKTSRRATLVRSLLILPLLSLLIYGFSDTATVERHQDSLYNSTNNKIEDIQIHIDLNSKIKLNGILVKLPDLKSEINNLNKHLTIEEKQKYLSANIDIENESLMEFSKEVANILYACNIRSWCVTNLQGEKDSVLKHIPLINPMTGKNVDEAEVLYHQRLKDLEEFKKSRVNVETVENNPWSVEVKKKENPWTIEVQQESKALPETSIEYNKELAPAPTKTSLENRNIYMVAQAPPSVNPNTIEYLKELAERGARFYIGPHEYSIEEAIKMVLKSTQKVTIDVSDYPKVILGGC